MSNSIQDLQYDSEEDSTNLPVPKKRLLKPANRIFKIVSQHQTPEEAFEAIQEYGSYSKLRECEIKEGIKVEFRCNQVKLRGIQCASSIQLLHHSADSNLTLFKTTADHTHDYINQDNLRQGIPDDNTQTHRKGH